ncbi:MAG: PilZ domain-containing protein, partial [Candidatus Margulisiibacteriota bacterium]
MALYPERIQHSYPCSSVHIGTMPNHRAAARVADKIPVQIKPAHVPAPHTINTRTLNISAKGICFRLRDQIPSGSFTCEFPLKKRGKVSSIKFTGAIVWSTAIDRGWLYGAHLVPDPSFEKDIAAFIAERAFLEKAFDEELSAYLTALTVLDIEIAEADVTPTTHNRIFHQLRRICTRVIQMGDKWTSTFYAEEIKNQIKARFRSAVGTQVYQSNIMRRGIEKPQGYAGDYQTIEFIYENQPISATKGLARYLDEYFLENDLSIAVRNRKNKMLTHLLHLIDLSDKNDIKILNIACGSCREIKELFQSALVDDKKLSFTCIDQDGDALAYSAKALADTTPSNVSMKFCHENVVNLLRRKNSAAAFGKFNLVYSIGLIDYLSDRLLKNFIKFCWDMLEVDGTLVLTHKDCRKRLAFLPPDWFCDWTFYSREKNELLSLIRDTIDNFTMDVSWE